MMIYLIPLALYALPALAAPPPLLQITQAQNPVPGRYIVTLKKGQGTPDTIDDNLFSSDMFPTSNVTHRWRPMNAFAGDFSSDDLETLRADPRVNTIEQDSIVRAFSSATQDDAPWGLSRISSRDKLVNQNDGSLDFNYTFDSSAGAGSAVYILDTGIYTDHPQFQGRARFGAAYVEGGNQTEDENGHGTHCAGVAVSSQFGVAKSASVIAVKVLTDDFGGRVSDVISGLHFVYSDSKSTGIPSVASLSFGTNVSSSLDIMVQLIVELGVSVVVAAGNNNQDVQDVSPARLPQAITVAASCINDTKADFSNFGSGIDVWAPGFNIISTFNDGGARILSGTSTSAAFVAGLVAYLLGLDSSLIPSQIETTIKNAALVGVLSEVPIGTPNILVNNAFSF